MKEEHCKHCLVETRSQGTESQVNMPIKVKPYKHQLDAFIFAMKVMGFMEA